MLHIGDPAPAFSAIDQSSKTHSLKDYAGRWLLLYFYPKDDTPGCTKEACGFRDYYGDLSMSVAILGVSKDDTASHKEFAEKFALPFPLLADSDRSMITAYGADGEAFPKRVSFLINPEGVIAKIYDKIDCDAHAEEVRGDIAEVLQRS